ncbi:hypothetical protein OK074_5932 [Actinobacteria bacterium OK074]|nr:hypothetical protein OK074_5932 [Actinobacteria bacterium OK074]
MSRGSGRSGAVSDRSGARGPEFGRDQRAAPVTAVPQGPAVTGSRRGRPLGQESLGADGPTALRTCSAIRAYTSRALSTSLVS